MTRFFAYILIEFESIYSGELITHKVSEERAQKLYDRIGRTYIFDLDPWWMKTVGSAQDLDDHGFIQLDRQVSAAAHQEPVNKPRSVRCGQAAPDEGQTQVECLYCIDAFCKHSLPILYLTSKFADQDPMSRVWKYI